MGNGIRAASNIPRKALGVFLLSAVFLFIFAIVIWKSHTLAGFQPGV